MVRQEQNRAYWKNHKVCDIVGNVAILQALGHFEHLPASNMRCIIEINLDPAGLVLAVLVLFLSCGGSWVHGSNYIFSRIQKWALQPPQVQLIIRPNEGTV